MRLRRHPGRPTQRGAGFVELVFVAPVLLLLTFGGIEFGIGWNEKIEMNQAVREAARQGATGEFEVASCATQATFGNRVACTVTERIDIDVAVHVTPHISGKDPLPGDELTVCAARALAGSTPIAGEIVRGKVLRSAVTMVVEKVFGEDLSGYSGDADPSGDGWSWCG